MALGELGKKGGTRINDKKKQILLERAESHIIKNLHLYLDKLEELANGVLTVKVDGRSGEETIYRTKPDRQALQFLIEHAKGKVPATMAVTGPDGEAIFQAWAPPKEVEEKKQFVEVLEDGQNG